MGQSDFSGFTTIAQVSFSHFTRWQFIDKLISKDGDVGPPATGKWAIGVNNITTHDGNSNLVPEAGPLELVAIPHLAERGWLLDPEVGSINRDVAPAIEFSALFSVLPDNLIGFVLEAW